MHSFTPMCGARLGGARSKILSPLLWLTLTTGGLLVAQTSPANAGPAVVAQSTLLEEAYALDAVEAETRDAAAVVAAYRRAAESGDAFAHLRLGYLLETADGVPHDPVAARQHYEIAVAGGVNEARLRLAVCHLEGWGGPVDRAAFAREVRAAAEAGYLPAQRILATLCFIGFAVPKDPEQGAHWLERAAAQDDPAAQLALGQKAERARGLELMPDKALARSWYQLSAEQEYAEAMRATARTFLQGTKSDRHWELGRRWLELAAESGDAEAPYMLAVHEMLHPDSLERNADKARGWLQQAAAGGNERAREVLDLEAAGRPLGEAMKHVLSVPFEERYIHKQIARADAESKSGLRRPVVYRMVQPYYPESLQFTQVQGKAEVSFVVDVNGRVVDATAVSATHPLFGERAVEAVRQWRFHPAQKDGRNVNTRVKLPMVFNLASETMKGVDGFLSAGRAMARRLSPAAAADAEQLMMAAPLTPLGFPRLPDGQPAPPGARVLLLLALDAQGAPTRGYVLEATPTEWGPLTLERALAHRYRPKVLNGETVAVSVLLPMFVRPGAASAPIASR